MSIPANFFRRFHVLYTLWTTCLCAALIVSPALASEKQALVAILDEAAWQADAPQTFIITHGLGGLSKKDRFAALAKAIRQRCPRANVVRLDWSATASLRRYGMLSPWDVARKIDDVAEQAVTQLQARQIAPERVTLIGESFGNYVNAGIARSLGGVRHLLAFNPASELGGYTPPDLRRCAETTCSFHTYSPFDTRRQLAHHELFLETPANSTAADQHTFGIVWLTVRLQERDERWLHLQVSLPATKPNAYCGQATLAGELAEVAIDRSPPPEAPSDAPPRSEAANSALVIQ